MGVMNKLRESTPIILWTLVLSFGILWVLQDTQVFDTIGMASAQRLAVVDGTEITYEEYQRALEQQTQQFQAQTGESIPDQLMESYRRQVFNGLVDNVLREHEMERLGITVSDSEVIEMVMGENPDPFIRQQFDDGQGGIDRNALRSALDNADAREQWILVEQYLRNKRRQEKLDNLIAGTSRISEQEVLAEYERRNRRVDIEFVSLRYADIPDDSVTVDEREMRRFYAEHLDEFERERTYEVDYVAWSKLPAREDTLEILGDLDDLKEEFAATEDDSLFVVRNGSERPFSSAYFPPDELDQELASAVFEDVTAGRIVGPVVVGGTAHLAKILDARPMDDTSVQARHILVRASESDDTATRAEARRKALDIMSRIRGGESFARIAENESDDPGSGQRGGDLGWFGPGRMVEPFENAAFSAPVGRLVGPVETEFGYHVIEVLQRGTQEVQIADVAYPITASTATLGDLQNEADDLQYFASESGDFVGEAEQAGLEVQQVAIQESMTSIPGLGDSRSILNFLSDAETGDISDVLEQPDNFLVLHVRSITEAGNRPFEEVRSEIEPRVRLEAKKTVQRERLENALAEADDLAAVAAALGTMAQRAQGISFTNTTIPGLGQEPKVVGRALGIEEENTLIDEPIEGNSAAFAVKVTRFTSPDLSSVPEATKNSIRQELLNQRRSQMQARWLTELRESADIEDNRARFSL